MEKEGKDHSRKGHAIRRYTLTYKLEIVRETEALQLNTNQASQHFGLPYCTLRDWLKQYGSVGKLPVPPVVLNSSDEKRLEALEAENKALRASLKEQAIKVTGLETMIDIAEQEFLIAIRKKPGTKQ